MKHDPLEQPDADLSQSFDGDKLDALLQQAEWESPGEDRVQRLQAMVEQQSLEDVEPVPHAEQGEPILAWWARPSLVGALAAAAAIALLLTLIPDLDESGSNPLAVRQTPDQPAESAVAPPSPAPDTNASPARSFIVRDANVVEIAYLRSHERKVASGAYAAEQEARARRAQFVELVEKSLVNLAGNSKQDVKQVAAELLEHSEGDLLEEALLRHLQQVQQAPHGNSATAWMAIRMLGEVGSRRSLPMLVAAAENRAMREAAMPGLLRLADAKLLEQLAWTEGNRLMRRKLLAAMLRQPGDHVTNRFLAFVSAEYMRDDALAAIDLVRVPPVDVWMQTMLHHPQMHVRQDAARAIGRGGDPQTLQQLVQLLPDPRYSRLAIVALDHSQLPMARQVLRELQENPTYAAMYDETRTASFEQTMPAPLEPEQNEIQFIKV